MSDFDFSLALCRQMAEAAEKAQQEMDVCLSIAITDRHGNLRFFYRFGDAIVPSLEIAQKKAYTSAVLGQSTREFGKIAQVDGDAFGINVTAPKLVIFGGGFPLEIDGKTVGGIGVSGGSVEEDEVAAQRMLEAFRRAVKGG
ncbi:MAG: heme-binding protein [Treponema sp.]|nr:heme-binding protein [Treponema sp.]